jgi:Flp pilus assembly protein TadG
MMSLRRNEKGQATVEMALVFIAGIIPLSFGLIAFAELAWTYHALTTLTRDGARYAATHCWQEGADNVVSWMKTNAPVFPDRAQLLSGAITIQVNYWTHNLDANESDAFSCDGAAGCGACVPDSVTVSITGYQFNSFLPALGLAPLQVPTFSTTLEVESAGGNSDPQTGN